MVSFVPVVLIFIFSGILWLSAKEPESRSESATESSSSSSGITPEILQSIAFSVAGIFIIIGTLGLVLNVISQIVQIYAAIHDGFPGHWSGIWMPLTKVLIRLILGIRLLLGVNGLRWLKASLLKSLQKDWQTILGLERIISPSFFMRAWLYLSRGSHEKYACCSDWLQGIG
jgi:hypothetical protein